MKIWVDENIPMGKEAFADHGETIRFAGRGLTRNDISGADALIVRSVTRVDAALLEGTPVRFVGTATIGTDHIDQEYLRSRGIGFSSSPGCNANSVGEYVTTALTWLETEKGFALEGKTIGIVGYGHVGKQVERKALALGLRVLRCDPPLRDAARAAAIAAGGAGAADYGIGDFGFTELPALLERSDILSLHVPLTLEGPYPTLRLADARFFERLTRPTVLLNTCRGEVIDQAALMAAMDAGRIRHLVLDVFTGEPRIDRVLAGRADLISPHIAGYSLQGKLNGTTQVAAAFRRFFGFDTHWAPIFPAPSKPDIDYSHPDSDTDFRRFCVASAYDLPADDKRLRDSLLEADPGKAFDRLRRDYPVRHEFPSYTIRNVPGGKRELRKRLADLGFKVA
ncbi:MAG: 4-phosphoerythronate dehydrogenase [Fibrobacteres bacterium]|nr:4-phosphoerythronate dehydrogenase [Fibrobacterota bacterium]